MSVYLIRHCKTENNGLGLVSGQSESTIVDYTVKSAYIFESAPYMYSSDSDRCRETILKFVDIYKFCKGTVKFDHRLRERGMGVFEGVDKKKLVASQPEYFPDGEYFNFLKTPPQGEPFSLFYERVSTFVEAEIMGKNQDIVICSHNQTLRLLQLILQKKEITYDNFKSISFRNGELNKIT